MADGNEARLAELLRQAQMMMVELLGRCAGTQRDWDRAKVLLDGAKQIDGILELLSGHGAIKTGQKGSVSTGPRKLPYYYVEYGKLVKVGRSRDGGTFEHRVTREHYDLIMVRLTELAKQGRAFETRQLVDLLYERGVPRHEPLVVLNMLDEQRLLKRLRRGHWAFPSPDEFADTVRGVWGKLPRH